MKIVEKSYTTVCVCHEEESQRNHGEDCVWLVRVPVYIARQETAFEVVRRVLGVRFAKIAGVYR